MLLSVFAEFGGHALKQEHFAMDADKICFTARRSLHWNTEPQGYAIPIAGDSAEKGPEVLGLPLQMTLHGTEGWTRDSLSPSQPE